ncbi:MAG: tetratricopeptide repeat protein, partial [Flavobacteriales bacterium]
MVRAFLILTLLCVGDALFAQTPAQYFSRGEQLAAQNDWAGAAPYLQQAYSLDSSRVEYIYYFGRSLIELNDYEQALPIMQRAYQLDLGAVYFDDLYWVGFLHFHLGHDIDAIQTIKAWLKKNSSRHSNPSLERAAKNIIASAEWKSSHGDFSLLDSIGDDYFNRPISIKRTLIQCSDVCSADGEQSPVLNDSLLHYSQWFKDGWRMRTALLQGDSLVQMVHSLSHAPMNMGQMTQLGNRCVGVMHHGESTLMEWKLDQPNTLVPWVTLGEAAFKATNPHLTVIQGDTLLFFAAQTAAGDFDLYYSKLDGKHWQSAVALGKEINSEGDEISPFYADGFLYFSSDGWPGYGGHDVYRVKLWDNTTRKP